MMGLIESSPGRLQDRVERNHHGVVKRTIHKALVLSSPQKIPTEKPVHQCCAQQAVGSPGSLQLRVLREGGVGSHPIVTCFHSTGSVLGQLGRGANRLQRPNKAQPYSRGMMRPVSPALAVLQAWDFRDPWVFFEVLLGGHSQGSQDCLVGQGEKEEWLDQHQGPSYKPAPAGRVRCESIPRAGTTSLDQVGASQWESLSSQQLPQVVGSPV